jgi:hypothetical protein
MRHQILLSRAALILWVCLSAIVGIFVFTLVVAPPLKIEATEGSALILFTADRRAVLIPGGCITVRWVVEGIKEAYLNGVGQVGMGERSTCVFQDQLPTLKVKLVDDTIREYQLPVGILVDLTWFRLLLLGFVVLLILFMQIAPPLRRHRYQFNRLAFPVAAISLLLPASAGYVTQQLLRAWAVENTEDSIAAMAELGKLGALVGFLALMIAAWILKQRKTELAVPPANRRPIAAQWTMFVWLVGLALIAVPVMGLIIRVDPTGTYGTKVYKSRLLCVRDEKGTGYMARSQPPDIAIVGASWAFAISPEHIRRTLGLTAFNATVTHGLSEDNLIMARFMFDHSGNNPPKVLLVNVVTPLPVPGDYTIPCTPLYMARYMPLSTGVAAIQYRLQGLFDPQQWSESLYVLLRYANNRNPNPGWTFKPDDGEGAIRPGNLRALLDRFIRQDAELYKSNRDQPCYLNDMGVQYTYELIRLADRYGSAVVFFTTPFHPEYYQAVLQNNLFYQRCQSVLIEFMRDLTRQHGNVFFHDFSQIDSFHGLDTPEGFYDYSHMAQANANRLIDAAAPTIQQAYSVAMQRRSLLLKP